jgi:energy-coupling factor transporter transmembrane protein EcfT
VDFILTYVGYLYGFFRALDFKLCWLWMKITGHGRKSYMAILTTAVYLFMIWVDIMFTSSDWIWMVDIAFAPLYFWFYYKYARWLRNPAEGLSTVKLNNVYYDTREIAAFTFILIFCTIVTILSVGLVFTSPVHFMFNNLARILLVFYFCVKSQSGPPQPNNTFWQQAKSKLKSLLETQRAPQLVPLPVRI